VVDLEEPLHPLQDWLGDESGDILDDSSSSEEEVFISKSPSRSFKGNSFLDSMKKEEKSSSEVLRVTFVQSFTYFFALTLSAWTGLTPFVSQSIIDERLPEFFEAFESLLLHYENRAVVLASCEALVTLVDMNQRLDPDNQYDIETDLIIARLDEFTSVQFDNDHRLTAENESLWKEFTRALQCDVFIVELEWLKFDTTIFKPKYGTPDSHRKKSLVKTGWTESLSLGFVRQSFGDVFNQLLKSLSFGDDVTDQPDFQTHVYEIVENCSGWELTEFNVNHSRRFMLATLLYNSASTHKLEIERAHTRFAGGKVENSSHRTKRRGALAHLNFDLL
jgi:hypothetical protein